MLELVTMSDFGMAETDDSLTPKVERMGNVDAKTFVWGQGDFMGKNIYKNFSIMSEN